MVLLIEGKKTLFTLPAELCIREYRNSYLMGGERRRTPLSLEHGRFCVRTARELSR